jgi:DNA-binding response OmpR family regulator
VRSYPVDQEILVVDDDPARRQRIVQILAAENFAVTAAAEGLAALRTVANRRFALIIAGLRLPGSLDGVATVRQARLRQPGLKALFTDASGCQPHLGNRDSDDFIAGPIARWELLGCVFELLQRGPAADLTRRARTERRAS